MNVVQYTSETGSFRQCADIDKQVQVHCQGTRSVYTLPQNALNISKYVYGLQ